MNRPIDVVRRFLALLEEGRAEEAVALLSADVSWRNTGIPTIRGGRVAELLRDMERRRIGFEARIEHIAGDGDIVLTQRTDVLRYKRWQSEFWVCGTFEVRDGLIVLWDDHFSMGNLLVASLKGLAEAVR
jgi:limonene-1,2-epoxide hydrolase